MARGWRLRRSSRAALDKSSSVHAARFAVRGGRLGGRRRDSAGLTVSPPVMCAAAMMPPLSKAPGSLGRPRGGPRTLAGIAWVLVLLLSLFAFRVGAQVLQRLWPIDLLPEFGAWQSGWFPYRWLLAMQLVLLGAGALLTGRVMTGRLEPRPRVGKFLLSLGALYFAAMLFRFGYALGGGSDGEFMGKPIPAFFHLVLSSWLMVLGLYHDRGDDRSIGAEPPAATLVHWLAYPLVIAVCLLLHVLLLQAGLHLQLSTYLPVAVGAVAITLLERRFPYRAEWQPGHDDVANDLTFMIFIQILLPKVLAFVVAVTALRFLQSRGLALDGLWFHDWPPLAQAGVMLLLADFLRYWLHRASHEWSPWLWRFHAVHHSPPKLYWVNVGRFHPIEKALQFLCDAAPFILLGVSERVLALYFVFYAVNGFFQHCNGEVRLGVLNFLISGPELHRWHHSREIRESNKNYGNNVILWDLLFGSFFLPKGHTVHELGLRNRAYPLDFLRQMKSPFIKGLDQDGQ